MQNFLLYVYIFIQGFSAWRHRTEGSFFIQCLCQELKANGCRKSIDEVVTDTVHRVQQETECMTPIVEYTLGKKTYLTDFQPTCDTQ